MTEVVQFLQKCRIPKHSEAEVRQIREDVKAYETFGLRNAAIIKYGELLPLEHQKELLIIKNPKWVGRPRHITLSQKFLGKSRFGKPKFSYTYLILVDIKRYKGKIPLKILTRATEMINICHIPPNDFNVAFVGNEEALEYYTGLVDPILLGFWNAKSGSDDYVFLEESKYCALLGVWGTDLEEIDLAFVREEANQ